MTPEERAAQEFAESERSLFAAWQVRVGIEFDCAVHPSVPVLKAWRWYYPDAPDEMVMWPAPPVVVSKKTDRSETVVGCPVDGCTYTPQFNRQKIADRVNRYYEAYISGKLTGVPAFLPGQILENIGGK